MRPLLALLLLAACTGGGDDTGSGDDTGPQPDASAETDGGGGDTLTVRTFQRVGWHVAEPEAPLWVAVQDGDGAWVVPAPDEDGVYTVAIADPGGRYGAAVACAGGVQVIHATLVEGIEVTFLCAAADPAPTRSITLDVATAGPCVVTIAHPPFNWETVCTTPASTFQNVPSGAYDLVAWSRDLDRVAIVRDLAASSYAVDLESPTTSRASAGARLDVADGTQWFAHFWTDTTMLLVGIGQGPAIYGGFPADLREPEDIHVLTIGAPNAAIRRYLREPTDQDFSAPPLVQTPTVEVTFTGADWEPYLASGFSITVGTWTMSVSTGWLGEASDYGFPRLCDEAGFPSGCADEEATTAAMFTAYRPAMGFVAALPEVLTAQQMPTRARDGLTVAQAMVFDEL